ncbi:MAG: hypothetical protein J6Q70_07655 [Clostridia bacterium]|nr:hypothetical protein [Clostridia bacterium]
MEKIFQFLQKVKQYLPYILWYVGLWLGLVFVPQFWFARMDYNHFFFFTYSYISVCTLPLFYHSFLRWMAIYNRPLRESFLQNMPQRSIGNHIKFLLGHLHFWLGYAAIVLLFCVFPLTKTTPTVLFLFGRLGIGKLLLVYLVLMLAVYVWANLSAIRLWRDDNEKRDYMDKKQKRNAIIILIAVYAVTPFAFLLIWDVVTRYIPLIYKLAQMYASPLLIVAVVFVILLAFSANFLRVMFARKKFLRQLQKSCREMGFEMTKIQRPYLSAFRVCRGESFQVTTHKKTYSCKLVGAPKRLLPLAIHPSGALHFIHSFSLFKATLYSHTTVKDITYDRELPKILIVNPVPIKLSCYFQNKIADIDNGARVGDYKIYTATAFIRAIETDTVERIG